MGRVVDIKYDNPVPLTLPHLSFLGVVTLSSDSTPDKHFLAVRAGCGCSRGQDCQDQSLVVLPDKDATEALIAMLRDHQDDIDRKSGGAK
jgi:hypothetical protein